MIIAICGPSGAGKSTFQKLLGLPRITTVTTRPIRPGELQGVDYHFVDEVTFDNLNLTRIASFAGHRYGVGVDVYEDAAGSGTLHSIILTPDACRQINLDYGDKVLVVAVQASRPVCAARIRDARGGHEACKRMLDYAQMMQASTDVAHLIVPNDSTDQDRLRVAARVVACV